jgi:hypothetical protein
VPDALDRAFDELDEAFVDAVRGGIMELAFLANDQLEALTRVDTGENRASAMGNWANGMQGGRHAPPPGLASYPVPRGESIRRAAAVHMPGEGLSTASLTDHAVWFERDETFEQVAEAVSGEVLG